MASAVIFAAALAAISQCGGSSNPNTPAPVAAALAGVPLNADSVIGGNAVQGNANLSANAAAGGATVTLSSSNSGVANVPASVTVPAGAATTGYTVTTSAVGSATQVTITGSFLGVTKTATLTVNPAPVNVVAAFTVTPDAGTTAPAGQCSVTKTTTGNIENILRCRFDAGSSTPNPGITEYRWQFPGAASAVTTSNPVVTDPHVPCGSFVGAAARQVMLTVTAPQGSNSTSPQITFVKSGEC
ncbi:MAG TPA: hypothetical protein VH417_16230 [Vicinamibacterales bacterium]|jgi:hypothetical protein